MLKAPRKALFLAGIGGFSFILCSAASQAQGLPPTNYGKFVHQPGDNQYENSTQAQRHNPQPIPQAAPVGQAASVPVNPGWAPTPAPKLPDISIAPIVADEPIKPNGFPPLPDRLDLPMAGAWSRNIQASGGIPSAKPSGPVFDGAGGAIDRGPQGVHEHYVHYSPNACIPNDQMPGAQHQAQSIAQGSSRGYYRCAPPDVYSVGSGSAGRSAPQEQEPRLNSRLDGLKSPDAPTALELSQPTTQDLSLPDDDYKQKSPSTRNTIGKQVSRGVQRAAYRTLYSTTSQFLYGGSSMLRMR